MRFPGSGRKIAAPVRRLLAGLWASVLVAVAAESAAALPPPPATDAPRFLARPVAVFGTDDRTSVPQRLQAAAERIGLFFNNRTRIVCSAFCVADNVIATAAHCTGRGQPAGNNRYGDFRFSRNYDRSRHFVNIEGAAEGTAAQHILAGDFRLRIRPPIDATHDWALVRVPRNTCPAKALEVKVLSADEAMTEAKAGRVFQLSYHRDLTPWRITYSKPCAVDRNFETAAWESIEPDFLAPEQLLLHTCDTGGASSGSPLLLETEGGPVVIAINVGTYVQTRGETPEQTSSRRRADTVANTAVSASAFAAYIAWFQNADVLTNRADIRGLQEHLRNQSLYTGRIDGTFGPALAAAIEAHERAGRAPVTGLPTRDLVKRLAEEATRGGQVAPSTEKLAPGR
jgi:V8-like Glu-specific endopeptidase